MLEIIEKNRKKGKKIGFTASTFDLLHPGHISMLMECKMNCDFLIVGLLTDPTISRPVSKNKPLQTTFERYMQIQAVKFVDLVIPFDTEKELRQMLLMIRPNIRFVGEEYKNMQFLGRDIDDIEIFFNSRKHNYSSTELRKRIKNQNENL
jgi:glycerol-3-phosphate cytidylyltransferase